MISKKMTVVLVVVAVLLTAVLTGVFRGWTENQEKARLQEVLTPVVAQAVEGTQDPQPTLSFISLTESSLVVVLRWEQKPEAAVKNDMRERVFSSIRRELAADPKSWGRHISVIFNDEVVVQGWK